MEQPEHGKAGHGQPEPLHEHPKDIALPHSIAIPCMFIRLGDYLLIQDRPCQVIKIDMSTATDQYRYLGVDVFTKKLFDETASVYNVGPNIVQTMLCPIFRKYRVLGLGEDGHVVALTDKGRIRERLPVLDQKNLWTRIETAFQENRDSVYVLVLEGDGIDLAVDVKVVHGKDLQEGAQFTELPPLHQLAQNGDLRGLQVALVNGEKINSYDSAGRTAIYHAIQNRQHHFITELLKQGIDIGRMDKEGKTAFDYIMEVVKDDPATYLIAEGFLEKKPSLTQSIGFPVPNLLSLSASGDLNEIEKLLPKSNEDRAIEVNKTDRLGYTPLHEAACFGQDKVVEMLIQSESDVNAEVTLGGDTVLHAVIDRRKHRRFLGDPRRNPPPLSKDHIKVVEILLKYHADSNRRRYSDNMTVQDVLFNKLKSGGLSAAERSILEQIVLVIDGQNTNQPVLTATRPTTSRDSVDQLVSLKVQNHPFGFEACHDSEQMLIDEFLRNPTPIPNGKEWRWIHLPKNNKIWVEEVANALQIAEGGGSPMYLKGVQNFINQAYDEIQCADNHPGMRRPSFNPLHESYPRIFSLVIPYFDSEVLECTHQSGCSSSVCQTHRLKETELRNKFNDGPSGPIKNLHDACTLDQSYYVSLKDTDYEQRNGDQVVIKQARVDDNKRAEADKDKQARAGKGKQEQAGKARKGQDSKGKQSQLGEGSRILMVKQMWIWRTSYDTRVTAFPERRHDHGSPVVGKSLFGFLDESMRRNPTRSIDSMVARMIQCAIDFANAPIYAAFREDILDIFQRSIARQADKEAACYAKFQELHVTLRGLGFNISGSKEETIAALCDVQNELDALLEIKDIAVELRMIQRVLRDQRHVGYDCMTRYGFSDTEVVELKACLEGVQARMSKVDKLLDDASVVESSLKNLLDMKQRHGNLNMVRDTRKRALDSDWQTQLLFIFTIVTVIFTPISYVCGFLAVPSKSFPNDGGDGVAWTWQQILCATIVTEGLVAIPIMIYWWRYKIEMVKKPMDTKTLNEKDVYQTHGLPYESLPTQRETRNHSIV